jgi:Tfp pilus assembly protein PilF
MDRPAFRKRSEQALAQGRWAELESLCRAARERWPQDPEPYFLESVVAEAGRNPGAALQLVTRALELSPDNVEYLAQKARYHSQVNQVDEAGACARRALELGVDSAGLLDTLGVVFSRIGDHDAAAPLLRRAARARPRHAQTQFNLAAAEQFLGNDDAARAAYEAVLALAPGHARSYWALSELEKNRVSDRHEKAMRRLADHPGLRASDALYLAHALARIDESRGDYAAAIERLSAAKARRRREIRYEPAQDLALFTAIRSAFADVEPLRAAVSASGPAPLFIVGLPRTGTTLVERMLCTLPAVSTLGELQELPLLVKRASGVAGPRVLAAEVAAAYGGDAELALRYASATAGRVRDGQQACRYLIDKMPLNFFYVGYILRCFPQARIVLLRRHPMDAGLSNYRQLFALDYSYYNYAYDLADTGHYCAAFEELVGHWQRVAGERLYSLHYEALVAEPETQLRSLLAYLDLPWSDALLDFHAQTGAVATPSAAQVRQPLYRDAAGRWRRYGAALAPLQAALRSAGVSIDQA